MTANASESELREFLDDTPQPWNHPITTAGYCEYRSPAPYGSEYTGYNHPTCFAPCTSFLGCNPPTPSYDQFVKWGEAAASYSLLNSEQFARAVAQDRQGDGARPSPWARRSRSARSSPPRSARRLDRGQSICSLRGDGRCTRRESPRWDSGRRHLAAVVGIIIVAVVIAVMQGIDRDQCGGVARSVGRVDRGRPDRRPGRGRADRHDRGDDHVVRPVRVGDVARAVGRVLRQLVHDPGEHQAPRSLRQPLMDSVSQSPRRSRRRRRTTRGS